MRYFLYILIVVISAYASNGDEECEDPNAYFTECGSECVRTCDNLQETLMCTPVCVPKCHCIWGFVLHESKCIRTEDCPKLNSDLEVCNDPNGEYTYCGSHCPLTCEHPVDTGCVDSCYEGCQCKEGYLLHQNSCVKPEECP